MSVLDDLFKQALSKFSDWVEINDPLSEWTIESFEKANYDDERIKPHCIDCVIVNHCWFKNEENKRPVEFNYSIYPEIPLSIRGLYHPNCHDVKLPIKSPKSNQIEVFDLERRKDYLFEDKKEWLYAMGYGEQDMDEVILLIEKLSKESYCDGDYVNNPPKEKEKKKYGFRIRMNLKFPGKGEKFGKIYKITSSFIVYPNGKLKNNTPIGGWGK